MADTVGVFDLDCAFCRIAAGTGTATIVRRWEDCLVISPLRPATLGHVMLIPVVHAPTIWELPVAVAERMAARTIETADVLRRETGLLGLNVIQSNGAAATQTVPHLHVHLVPRYQDDGMGTIWPETGHTGEAETAALMRRLTGSASWPAPPG